MLTTNAFAKIGALVGDPARATMLLVLMDGRALTAAELAVVAGVTPQTASSHLVQLVTGGLLTVQRQGRHRYHCLATPEIAQMIEGMMAVAAVAPTNRRPVPRSGPRDMALRQARTCYDHLAGRVAVAIADRMIARGEIEFGVDGGKLTNSGVRFLSDLGVNVPRASGRSGRKRAFCRPCLDWSERRPHIAGLVGRSLLDVLIDQLWLRKIPGSRAVTVTPLGQHRLTAFFGLEPGLWDNPV